jgi:hypothetical protein
VKRLHVTASAVIVAQVLFSAALYRAPFLAFFAIPSTAGLLTARRHPRAGAVVCAVAGLLLLAIAVPNAISGPGALDLMFDVVCGVAGAIAVVDGVRSAFSGTPVTAPADR